MALLAALGRAILGVAARSLITPVENAITTNATYKVNAMAPWILPAPEMSLHLLHAHRAGADVGFPAALFLAYGIDVTSSDWNDVFKVTAPNPSPELLMRALWAEKHGLDIRTIPEVKTMLAYQGIDVSKWGRIPEAIAFPLTWHEILDLYFRNLISMEQVYECFRSILISPQWDYFAPMFWSAAAVPGPSDLIRFMVREAFNEQIVRKYGYDEEYPEEIERWLRAQGMNYTLSEHPATWGAGGLFGGQVGGGTLEKDPHAGQAMDIHWGRIYWRAHWDLPSPTQAYQMLFRLRPEAAPRIAAQLGVDPDSIVTTINEVRDLLKIADYPKYWRDRLIAISYLPINRTDLKAIITEGVPDPVPPEERLQDLGYTKDDAKVVAGLFKRRATLTLANRGLLVSLREAMNMFADNLITKEELQGALEALDLDDKQKDMAIATALLRRKYRIRKAMIRYLVRAYVRSIISGIELREQLRALGLDNATIDEIIGLARLQRLSSSRRMAATGVLWDFQRGLRGFEQALEELVELGYVRHDARRMLRRAAVLRQEQILRQLQSYYRALQSEIRRIIAAQDRRRREIRRLMREQGLDEAKAAQEYERRLKEAEEEAKRRQKEFEKQAEGEAPETEEAEEEDENGEREEQSEE